MDDAELLGRVREAIEDNEGIERVKEAMKTHVTSVIWMPAWAEWRPECHSCRWVGSYWKDEHAARREVLRHVRDEGEPDAAQ
jgi:hypothetical protein